MPRTAQDAYAALRTLNLELARLPETVSNPAIGRLRMQFWRDTVNNTFAGRPSKEPISILLHSAVTDLAARVGSSSSSASSLRYWLLRLINTREKHMEDRPFASLAALEEYAENTYATLMYMTLAAMPLQSVHVDHLASHIGKACGIVAVLRGIPVLASSPKRRRTGANAGDARSPALLLPLDVMAKAGLKEEDVFRRGPAADGLQDAVWHVAIRANDHLITARHMLRDLQAGKGPGHDYEYQAEPEHAHSSTALQGSEDAQADVQHGFRVLLEAVVAQDYLHGLEKANFDPFNVKRSWKLPWSLWNANKRREI